MMIQMLASIPLLAAMPAVDTVTATQDAAGLNSFATSIRMSFR